MTHTLPMSDDATIAALSKGTHTTHDVVKRLYDLEVAALQAEARVKHFIPLIAGRRVRERLRDRKASH